MGVLHDRKQPHGTAKLNQPINKLNQPINMTAMGAAFGTFRGTLAGVVILCVHWPIWAKALRSGAPEMRIKPR
jgi:uncharacterized membrane protein